MASTLPSSSNRFESSDSETQDSSDGEYGVFLGPHDPLENQLVSKLSDYSPLYSISRPKQKPVLIKRIRKRDSREFLRRKTFLSSDKNDLETEEKVLFKGKGRAWEGGFHERIYRRGSESDSSTSDSSSPECVPQLPVYSDDTPTLSKWATNPGHSDLTLDFSAFCLTETPPTSVSSVDMEPNDRESVLQGCEEEEANGAVGDEDKHIDNRPGNIEKEKTPMVETDFTTELGSREANENETDGAGADGK